jgi:hypothetical protein
MNIKLCPFCNKEPISTKFKFLNLGDNCISFYGIKSLSIPSRQGLSSHSSNSNNHGKFNSMTFGLAMTPEASLSVIEKTYGPYIDKVVRELPYLGNRSIVDILTAAELNSVSNHPEFLQARQAVLKIVHTLHNNFKLFLEDKLHEGLNLAEAQISGIREFLSIPQYSHLEFSEIYTEGEVSQEQINRVISSFQVASSLIPDKYKSLTPVPTIIIRGEGNNSAPFASAAQKSLIVLNLQKNLITQIAEAFHEYLHLIEQFNENINILTNKFLLVKNTSLTQKSMKDIGIEYKKPFKASAGDVLVYEGPFIDSYVGRTYGVLDPLLKKIVTTEVLSVGGEALLLNPTTFSLRDPDHFNLIKSILKGEV